MRGYCWMVMLWCKCKYIKIFHLTSSKNLVIISKQKTTDVLPSLYFTFESHSLRHKKKSLFLLTNSFRYVIIIMWGEQKVRWTKGSMNKRFASFERSLKMEVTLYSEIKSCEANSLGSTAFKSNAWSLRRYSKF